MKKIAILLAVFFTVSCTTNGVSTAQSVSGVQADTKLHAAITQTMKARGVDVDVTVERLKDLDNPQGFYFYKINISVPANNISQDQYLFYNGKYIVEDFADAETGERISRELLFDLVKTDIDTSSLTLIAGKAGAKNIIVEITDFECPYCRSTSAYLEQKLAGRDDVAVYVIHMPLNIHPTAIPMARSFEAGMMMGHNFAHELFSNNDFIGMDEQDLIDYFASNSNDSEKFIELYNSEEVTAKLNNSLSMAGGLNINSTPILYINGSRIEGFDTRTIDKAFDRMK